MDQIAFNPPPAKPGGEISAEHIQAILDIRDSLVIDVQPPLYRDGNTVYLQELDRFWAKITGAPTGTAHPWLEQIPQTGGTWADGPRSGTATTDPAYEVGGSTATLTNKIVEMTREEASGDLRFKFGVCS